MTNVTSRQDLTMTCAPTPDSTILILSKNAVEEENE